MFKRCSPTMATRSIAEVDPLELRKHLRPSRCDEKDDPHAIHAGEYLSPAEGREYEKYRAQTNWIQYLTMHQIRMSLLLRYNFINGNIRRGLTAMALYALVCEFAHDFHHVMPHLPHAVEEFLSAFHTKHAVGIIALSHLSEHYKEHLESQEKPKYRLEEKARSEFIRIYGPSTPSPVWPRYIQRLHSRWTRVRGDLPPFRFVSEEFHLQAERENKEGGAGRGEPRQ